jgi:hypothetical protein
MAWSAAIRGGSHAFCVEARRPISSRSCGLSRQAPDSRLQPPCTAMRAPSKRSTIGEPGTTSASTGLPVTSVATRSVHSWSCSARTSEASAVRRAGTGAPGSAAGWAGSAPLAAASSTMTIQPGVRNMCPHPWRKDA